MKNLNTKQLNKKLLLFMGIGIGMILIIALGSFVLNLFKDHSLSYSEVETKMIKAATNYYKKKPELLPEMNGGMVVVDLEELVSEGEIKKLDSLLKNGNECEGEVIVTKTDTTYYYAPTLTCGKDYVTTTLSEKITEEKNIVTEGDGLYIYNNAYVFRGEKINNNVTFGGKKWKILRVNEDGTIRLLLNDKTETTVWDDRYNTEKESSVGINDFGISRIRDTINALYQNKEFLSDNDRSKIVPQDLCIGKRSRYDDAKDGSIECAEVMEKQPVGLIQVNEYLLASLDPTCETAADPQCKNYNYLANLRRSTWTLTADIETTHKVFKLSQIPSVSNASSNSGTLVTIHINSGLRYTSGEGTEENPYVIK